ncbi:MAG: hypothetical protein AAGC60_00980 [Acidobacteriota bacterium]
MHTRTTLWLVVLACVALCVAPTAMAGTQDFTLVNQTGDTLWEIYISETSNDDWEEDVLGRDVLDNGARLDISFHGRRACLWDIMVIDEYENSVTWNSINLCEASVVVLRCSQSEGCWAEYE